MQRDNCLAKVAEFAVVQGACLSATPEPPDASVALGLAKIDRMPRVVALKDLTPTCCATRRFLTQSRYAFVGQYWVILTTT